MNIVLHDQQTFSESDSIRSRFDQRHGGPFDRGAADSWYSRPFAPHFFIGATNMSDRVELRDMNVKEIVAYTAGYNWNERFGGKKDWS